MALTIGELVATLDADDTGMLRGLTAAELAMAGFERDATGHLRRVTGEYVSTGVAAREMGQHALQGASRAQLAAAGLQRASDGSLRDVRGRYVSAGAAAERMGHQMLLASDAGSSSMRRLGDDADRGLGERGVSGRSRLAARALSALRGGLSGVGAGAVGLVGKLAPLLAQLGSAVPLVAGLVGTLESIIPAASVAASGIVLVVSAVAAVKLATHGVGDAVKAAFDPGTKPAELAAALKGLAPTARQFVLALRAMKSELHTMQQEVQGEVFAGLGAQITALSRTLLPTLTAQLDSTGTVLNMMASQALATATRLSKGGVFDSALMSANNSLYDLAGVPSLVIQAFAQLAAAAGPTLNKMTAGVAGAVDGLSAKLNASFSGGGLTMAIDTAVGVLHQLGTVAGNVGAIIGSVFSAAGAAGGSWLGILGEVTTAMRVAFASPAVQSALTALFSTMRVLGQTVGPLVAQALGVIGPVLTALGPPAQVLVEALGSALSPIIKALGPVLLSAAQAVGALVVALSPLLGLVGGLIAQLLPILTPVLKALGTIFGRLAGPIKQLSTALSTALQPVIAGLSGVLGALVDQFLDSLLTILGQLLPLIPQLTPVLVQLGQSIGQILTAVMPLLPQILMLAVTMDTQLLSAILPLIPPLAQLATGLLILATGVITAVVVPSLSLLIKFLGGLQKAFEPAVAAVRWLTTTISALFEWLSDHLVGHSVIPDMVRAIVSWLAGLPGKAMAAIAALPGNLASVASAAASRMVSAVRSGVASAVSAAGTLASRAKSAVGSLGGVLYGAGQSLLRGFISGIKSMIGSVKSTLGGITSSLTSWKGPPSTDARILRPNGRLVIGGFMAGIADQVPALRAQLGGLTGGMPGMALGGGFAPAGARAGVGGADGQQTVRVVLDVQGGGDGFVRAIRETVRVKGGGGPNSVQRTFG